MADDECQRVDGNGRSQRCVKAHAAFLVIAISSFLSSFREAQMNSRALGEHADQDLRVAPTALIV